MKGGHKRPDLTSASDAKQDRADDLLGAVVPSRGYDSPAVAPTPESDLSNVILFTPRGRKTGEKNAPALKIAANDRPAPWGVSVERQRQIALLIGGSLLIHGAIFAAFNREPEPHASIGMISVTAEIVLGAQTNAGKSANPSESDGIESPYSPKTELPTDTKPEMARKDIAKKSVEEPKEESKPAKAETASSKAEEAPPVEKPPAPAEQAELVVQTKPAEKPTQATEEKKPEAKETKKVREAARHAKDDGDGKRDRAAPEAAPSAGSNSVGRGRSDRDTNYVGIIFAHLVRYKQMPSDVPRGAKGTATVSFSLNSSGSVTSVRLVHASGVSSFDREAMAMVRRASPFPPPPLGHSNTTVPVTFEMR